MPIYEYKCDQCGEVFEEFQSITAPLLKRCRLCGAGSVHRVLSNTSFILKGTGWYVTDYARKGSGNGKGRKEDSPPKKKNKRSASSTTSTSAGV